MQAIGLISVISMYENIYKAVSVSMKENTDKYKNGFNDSNSRR